MMIVTRAETAREFPYREPMKSEIVVIRWALAIRTTFLRTIHQREAARVGPV